MRFMIRGRATGKTHELMHWLVEHPNGVVVAHNQREADRLFDLARIDHGLEVRSNQFISVNLAFKGALRGRNVPVSVDNLDVILRMLIGNVDIVTATGELYDEERGTDAPTS